MVLNLNDTVTDTLTQQQKDVSGFRRKLIDLIAIQAENGFLYGMESVLGDLTSLRIKSATIFFHVVSLA